MAQAERWTYANGTPLQVWLRNKLTEPKNHFFAWDAMVDQVCFVRDRLNWMLKAETHVISTHMSKSVEFPVYRISNKEKGFYLFLRGNLYDWKLSVLSTTPIMPPPGNSSMFRGFIDEASTRLLNRCYFEGFPEDLVFQPYAVDQSRWSAMVGSDYSLWAVCALLSDALFGRAT